MTMTSTTRVSPEQYRDALAAVCTPVCVVTTEADGTPHGTTVSAFTALSLDPPMVLVSLDRGSDLLALIRQTGHFGLNVLSSKQSAVALNFARKGVAKFDGVEWHSEQGVPRLPESSAFLACEVGEMADGGDHVVVFGVVHKADGSGDPPLTYHQRSFGTHAPES